MAREGAREHVAPEQVRYLAPEGDLVARFEGGSFTTERRAHQPSPDEETTERQPAASR